MKASWDPTTYDRAWERLSAAGKDPHGEVAFLERLATRHTRNLGRVLDAGCGTGRVAIELAARGYRVEGTDIDADMLGHAKHKAPHVQWHLGNLANVDLGYEMFDTVVAAGNVILFVDPAERSAAAAGLARHVASNGYLVAGFQLNRADGRMVAVDDWLGWLADAGLQEIERFSTWDDDEFGSSSDYIVTVHRRPDTR